MHRPIEQNCGGGQKTPHAPQFIGSLLMSVQPDGQTVRGEVQGLSHEPKMQSSPDGQELKQRPQWSGSINVMVQLSPHNIGPMKRPGPGSSPHSSVHSPS